MRHQEEAIADPKPRACCRTSNEHEFAEHILLITQVQCITNQNQACHDAVAFITIQLNTPALLQHTFTITISVIVTLWFISTHFRLRPFKASIWRIVTCAREYL
jgi:hypothetical protein